MIGYFIIIKLIIIKIIICTTILFCFNHAWFYNEFSGLLKRRWDWPYSGQVPDGRAFLPTRIGKTFHLKSSLIVRL